MRDSFMKYLYEKRWLAVWIILAIAIFAPSIKAGIVLTDEIELRLNNVKGFWEASRVIIGEAAGQGRITNAIPFILFSNIAFRLKTTFFFRSMSALIVILIFYLACRLVCQITENKAYSKFLFLFLLICLPFTFEHTIPNGFVAFLGMPFALILISLICFVKILQTGRKGLYFWVCSCLFVALLSYEAFIMYTPLYLFVALYYKKKRIKETIASLWPPASVGVLYLIIYVLQRKVLPSNYAGSTIEFKSLKDSMAIIINLFKTGIPGYFCWTEKYQYTYYRENILRPTGLGKFKYFLENGMTFRLFIIFILLFLLLYGIWRGKEGVVRLRNRWGLFAAAIAYMILPSLPISVSSGYQGKVNEDAFMALPVSFYIYIAGCVAVTAILWSVFARKDTWIGLGCLALACILFLFPIQLVNERVLKIEGENWKQYLYVEQMLSTQTARSLIENQNVYAEDLYTVVATRYMYLGLITDALYNYQSNFCHQSQKDAATVTITWENQEYFMIENETDRRILSKKPLETCIIRDREGDAELVNAVNGNYDNGFYVYEVNSYEK